jgi:hypothetical protein
LTWKSITRRKQLHNVYQGILLLNPPIPSILDSCLDAIDIKRRESIEHLAMQFSTLSPENAASVSQIAVLAFCQPKERLGSSATCRI